MGASNSRPVKPQQQDHQPPLEKSGFPGDAETVRLPSVGHSSAERLYCIGAEAAIKSHSSRPSSATLHVSSFSKWQQRIDDDPVSRLAGLTLHNSNINSSLRSRKAETLNTHVFNTVIDHDNNPITNQQSTGRCWLFATTNLIRNEMMKTLNTDSFQLSQSYLFFWDKVEKSNYFLENTLDLYDRPVDDRIFAFLKTEPVNDGGQWDMAASLLAKYGVVPQTVYPESRNSSSSRAVDSIITTKLRHGAVQLRKLKREAVDRLLSFGEHVQTAEQRANDICRQAKYDIVEEVFKILSLSCGAPPNPDEEFVYEYRDKRGKFMRIESTPQAFFKKYAPEFDPAQYASLVHDPRQPDKVLLTVDRLGNVKEGNPIRYVSASMQDLKASLIKQIQAGVPVFFGVDVGQSSDTQLGIMDTDLFDLEAAFGVDFSLTKAERIELGESSMTHAMVVSGVHLEPSSSSKAPEMVRCKVENSWGPDVGDRGYFVASSRWFDEFVFQVVIRKDFMPKDLWEIFQRGIDADTIVLPPYDPMGALAKW